MRFCLRVLLTLMFCAIALPAVAAPPVHHVFVVVLENEVFTKTFAADSPAPYLAHELPGQGALLSNYYAIGHASLDNYIAMISGQPPNDDTQRDCDTFTDFTASAPRDKMGVLPGHGCVYPRTVASLADQLEAKRLSWRGYMEDMGKDPVRENTTCGHVALGARDPLLMAKIADQYASKHNPFIYFHAIIDRKARCDAHVVNLDRLQRDLASISTTPNLVYITPNLCHDGHDHPCVDGRPGGLISMDAFLRTWIARITASPAYKKDGLIVITFDEADQGGSESSTACCGEVGMRGANFLPGRNGPGGGRIGAVLLSRFIAPGTVSAVPYNHYALLRSIEDIFALPHLGLANGAGVKSFGAEIFKTAH